MSKIELVANTIWSKKYYREISSHLKANKYDIVHVQNFFPLLSPSIFKAAKDNNVKVVMSVRNYRLICPNALMFIQDSVCQRCVGKIIPYPSVLYKCYKGSFSATFVTAAMLSYHNLLRTWHKQIDGFIAISDFVKSQLLLGGFDENKIFVKHNFVGNPPKFNVFAKKQYVYLGRLSVEKGIDVLLQAFQTEALKQHDLVIIGEGPLAPNVLSAASQNINIKYFGKLSPAEAYKIVGLSRALIFSSKWLEPFGRTIVESFASGTPVIGAAVGGVSELIVDGVNGYLFNPNIFTDLVDKIIKIDNAPNYAELRTNAYHSYTKYFTEDVNYERVMEIYNDVLESN